MKMVNQGNNVILVKMQRIFKSNSQMVEKLLGITRLRTQRSKFCKG